MIELTEEQKARISVDVYFGRDSAGPKFIRLSGMAQKWILKRHLASRLKTIAAIQGIDVSENERHEHTINMLKMIASLSNALRFCPMRDNGGTHEA